MNFELLTPVFFSSLSLTIESIEEECFYVDESNPFFFFFFFEF